MYFLHKPADDTTLLQKHLSVVGPKNMRLRDQPFPSQSTSAGNSRLRGLASLPCLPGFELKALCILATVRTRN